MIFRIGGGKLSDLSLEAFHDWGEVPTDFHEFVVLNRQESSLTLIVVVAAD